MYERSGTGGFQEEEEGAVCNPITCLVAGTKAPPSDDRIKRGKVPSSNIAWSPPDVPSTPILAAPALPRVLPLELRVNR